MGGTGFGRARNFQAVSPRDRALGHRPEGIRETNLAASHGEYVAGMTTPPRNEPNADPNKLPIVIRGGKKSPIR
jgi:hypothetical protein